jgi:hypothetical protein
MALQRSTVRKLLVLCALCLVAITLGGAYLVQDNRVLLLLLPPSLTYFLLDAVKDAKHQKQLQAALDVTRAARRAAEEAEGERAAAKVAKGDKSSARQTPRRTKAA